MSNQLRVLLTGADGRIGRTLLRPFSERYELRCLDRMPMTDVPGSFCGELKDIELLKRAMKGVDVVVHLAGMPNDADYANRLVPDNIVGNYNIIMAAIECGVRRIVYASSCQVVISNVSRSGTMTEHTAYNPMSVYGATKAFGEIMGRWAHDYHNLEFLNVRVGWFLFPEDARLRDYEYARSVWLSPGDTERFFTAAVDAPNIGFDIVYATSITEGDLHLSLDSARSLLGYEPRDDVRTIEKGSFCM